MQLLLIILLLMFLGQCVTHYKLVLENHMKCGVVHLMKMSLIIASFLHRVLVSFLLTSQQMYECENVLVIVPIIIT